jgi:hypothetical protein
MTLTVQTLSAVAVRIIGWLVILAGVKSFLSLGLISMTYALVAATTELHQVATRGYISTAIAVISGLIELAVGCLIIRYSKSLGRLLCRGIDETS